MRIKEKRSIWISFFLSIMIFLFAGLVFSSQGKEKILEGFENPEREYMPWVRWWLPGGDVEEKELIREINLLVENFFGGAEIQAFNAGLNPKASKDELDKRLSFDTDTFYSKLISLLKSAKEKGLTIDLTVGSGWPSGGMHIDKERALKTMLYSELSVKGPKKISVKLKKPKKPLFYSLASLVGAIAGEKISTYLGDEAKLVCVVALKEVAGRRSLNPLNVEDSILVDSQTPKEITRYVDENNVLNWEVPSGSWRIVSIYIAPDGEYPVLIAQPEPGFVVDHFDKDSVLYNIEHLLGERTGLPNYFGSPIRAFFNDSFEFKVERHFSYDFFEEFQKRRGYDLKPYVPATLIPGGDNSFVSGGGIKTAPLFSFGSSLDSRFNYDYSLTVSDLFIERFEDASRRWAEEHKLLSRVQSYGLDVDVIKAAGHSDIPETEQLYAGGSEMFLKIASSAGHLYNKAIITAESMVWAQRDYMTTPLKIKVSADKLFTSGINQIIYHGFPYQKNHDYGETGWEPFSSPFAGFGTFSSNISPANPFFKYISILNHYIARCQYALRQGRPDTDLIIYYPWLGFPGSFSLTKEHDELLFNGEMKGMEPEALINPLISLASKILKMEPDHRSRWLETIWELAKKLEDNGYSWEWANDDSLKTAESRDGKIVIRGNSYKALIVAYTDTIQPEVATRILELSEKGSALLFVGKTPQRQPGFYNYEQADKAIQNSMEKILKAQRARLVDSKDKLVSALEEIKVEPGINFLDKELSIRHIRRRLENNSLIIFFSNPERKEYDFRFFVSGGCKDSQWLDPLSGKRHLVKRDDKGAIVSHLDEYGSIILACENPEKPSSKAKSLKVASAEKPYEPLPSQENLILTNEIPIELWELEVRGDDVPKKEFKTKLHKLIDWREIKELRYCSSPGVYKTEIEINEDIKDRKIILDLGWLYGAGEMKVNDKSAGILLVPPYRVDIKNYLVKGKNKVEVIITPSLRNRLLGKALSKEKGYEQFKGKEETALPNGLLGPTRLIFMEKTRY